MSLRAELLRLGIRVFLKRRRGTPFDLEKWRANMRTVERLVPAPPARSETAEIKAGRLTFFRVATDASRPRRNVLYLHGGAYVSGAPAHYRHFTWRIADALHAAVWSLEYRLAPEHPFPAALDDAADGYDWLTSQMSGVRQLYLMGDSAGGGLVLALLLRLRDEGKPPPVAAVALSPWTDLALTGVSLKTNAAADPMLNVEDLPSFAALYLAGADPRTPYASPLYGDPSGLPPVLLQVGGDEILRDDSTRMAERLRHSNPRSRVEVWPHMPHVWQLYAPVLPEARRAIAHIGAFVAQVDAD